MTPVMVDRAGLGGMYYRFRDQLPVGGEYGTIYKNGMLKSGLQRVFGQEGRPRRPGRCRVCAIRDHVASPRREGVHAVTFFPRGIESLKADFRLIYHRRAGQLRQGNPYRTAHSDRIYSGAPIDTIAFVFLALPVSRNLSRRGADGRWGRSIIGRLVCAARCRCESDVSVTVSAVQAFRHSDG